MQESSGTLLAPSYVANRPCEIDRCCPRPSLPRREPSWACWRARRGHRRARLRRRRCQDAIESGSARCRPEGCCAAELATSPHRPDFADGHDMRLRWVLLAFEEAKSRPNPALAACTGAARAQAKDPADLVKKTGEGCARRSSRMAARSDAPALRAEGRAPGEQVPEETTSATVFGFKSDEGGRTWSSSFVTSGGDIVAESRGSSRPKDGAACSRRPTRSRSSSASGAAAAPGPPAAGRTTAFEQTTHGPNAGSPGTWWPRTARSSAQLLCSTQVGAVFHPAIAIWRLRSK